MRAWPVWGVLIFALHVGLGDAQFGFAMHVGTAVPGVLVVREAFRTFTQSSRGRLPFVFTGLVQYYLFFGLPVFRDRPFITLVGPFTFSEDAKLSAAIAIAVGAMAFVAARPTGERIGAKLQATLLKVLPPERPSPGFLAAVVVYTAFVFGGGAFLALRGDLLAPAIIMVFYVTVSVPFALGLWFALAMHPARQPLRARIVAVPIAAAVFGLLSGQLEGALRAFMVYIGGIWSYWRKIPVLIVTSAVVFYFLLNPVKFEYRATYWFGDAVDDSTAGRLKLWGTSFVKVWLEDSDRTSVNKFEDSADRLAEMGQVLYVFDVVPRVVPFNDGETWIHILTSPIPRVLWPSKPDTREISQVFRHRAGLTPDYSISSFVLPILVDGYWNLGWFGIVFACLMVGLYLGAAERVFTTRHWALVAAGCAHLAGLTSYVHLGSTFMKLFQLGVGHTFIAWGVYFLARALTRGGGQ